MKKRYFWAAFIITLFFAGACEIFTGAPVLVTKDALRISEDKDEDKDEDDKDAVKFEINIVSDFPLGNGDWGGIAYEHGNDWIWLLNRAESRIYKYSASGSLQTYITVTGLNFWVGENSRSMGLAYDGGKVYTTATNDLSKIYEIETYDGSQTGTISRPSFQCLGMVFDVDHFWLSDYSANKIYKLTKGGTQVLDKTVEFSGTSTSGLGFLNGYLYVMVNGSLQRFATFEDFKDGGKVNMQEAGLEEANFVANGDDHLWFLVDKGPSPGKVNKVKITEK